MPLHASLLSSTTLIVYIDTPVVAAVASCRFSAIPWSGTKSANLHVSRAFPNPPDPAGFLFPGPTCLTHLHNARGFHTKSPVHPVPPVFLAILQHGTVLGPPPHLGPFFLPKLRYRLGCLPNPPSALGAFFLPKLRCRYLGCMGVAT